MGRPLRFELRRGPDQITTYLQNFLASISHDLFYAKARPDPEQETAHKLLGGIFRDIQEVDQDVADAFNALKQL